ncbi:UPF0104 family protein [Gemelliphila palaticanis]|uniref:UPF0104 family protein n=1 Tax=Gemelliphila palaticanis TaxID=81950 RepID=A0ABX2T0Z2_9BACL|nr:UPF0104 family protein [Gemella palaticanis]MBF0715139.1 UPF0104 family protein [Gemella palaticanis]NYS47069.1 UPF0104 family protein [Gemella palaticanis]
MENNNKTKNYNIIKAILQFLVAIVIMFLVVSHLKKEISNLDFDKITYLIVNLGSVWFSVIIILGVVGMSILSFYDFFVLKAITMNANLKKIKIFKISFMTNSLNMILGFGGFIGAGLRYYLYKPYSKNNGKLLVAIGMILISMLSGISLLSIFVILDFLPGADLYSGNKFLYYSLFLISAFLPIYLYFNMRNPKIRSDRYLAIKLAIISFVEWIYAAILILLILFIFSGELVHGKELRIIGIIVVSAIAGLLSMIPSGVGVFDYLVLAGLGSLGFEGEVLAATIFLYRLSYYIVPFIISIVLLIFEFFNMFIINFKKGGN